VPADYVDGTDRYYPADPLIRRLWGRFRQPGRAPNVFKLVDGTYTTQQPYDWPTQGAVIAFVYYGAHTYQVTQAEADALTAAGFGAGVGP
jgi:hypothetical protein